MEVKSDIKRESPRRFEVRIKTFCDEDFSWWAFELVALKFLVIIVQVWSHPRSVRLLLHPLPHLIPLQKQHLFHVPKWRKRLSLSALLCLLSVWNCLSRTVPLHLLIPSRMEKKNNPATRATLSRTQVVPTVVGHFSLCTFVAVSQKIVCCHPLLPACTVTSHPVMYSSKFLIHVQKRIENRHHAFAEWLSSFNWLVCWKFEFLCILVCVMHVLYCIVFMN